MLRASVSILSRVISAAPTSWHWQVKSIRQGPQSRYLEKDSGHQFRLNFSVPFLRTLYTLHDTLTARIGLRISPRHPQTRAEDPNSFPRHSPLCFLRLRGLRTDIVARGAAASAARRKRWQAPGSAEGFRPGGRRPAAVIGRIPRGLILL